MSLLTAEQVRFLALSYIPGTRSWRLYRRVTKHVDDVMALAARLYPGTPRFPQPVPRDREMLLLALDSMEALLRALSAGMTGGDPAAVFGEHMPSAGTSERI